MNKRKNWEVIIGTIGGLSIVGGGIGIYYAVKNKDAKNSDPKNDFHITEKTTSIYQDVDIFPKLNAGYFYQYVKMQNGKPIITDDFVAAVAKKVISEMKVTDGNIEFSYQIEKDGQSATVSFLWNNEQHGEKGKTYKFFLSV